jgi:hypothetical protein
MPLYKDRAGGQHFFTKNEYVRWQLPYGCYHCADGREVLFDRRYRPICQRYPGQPPTIANPAEWVTHVRQEWFYDDATPHKRKIATAKLAEWQMTEPVMQRIKTAHQRREWPSATKAA